MARILLLEDNKDMREAIREALEIFEFEVITGRDGNEGLAALENEDTRPDLIITDLGMPHVSGEELLQIVRQQPELSHIAVIIMSGSATHREHLLKTGADAYIVKPFNFNDLFQLINKILA